MNHAQEAADMLDGTNPHGSPQEALAHATLALVEQQRIANLIAFADFGERCLTDAERQPSRWEEDYAAGVDRFNAAVLQIREGLGLA